MPKSSPAAWAVRAAKAVLVVKAALVALVVKVALVADALPVADDLMVLMLQAEIRKAIARDDQQRNRLQLKSVRRAACVSLPVHCDLFSQPCR